MEARGSWMRTLMLILIRGFPKLRNTEWGELKVLRFYYVGGGGKTMILYYVVFLSGLHSVG